MDNQESLESSALIAVLLFICGVATAMSTIVVLNLVEWLAPHQMHQFEGSLGLFTAAILGFVLLFIVGMVFCLIWALWPRHPQP